MSEVNRNLQPLQFYHGTTYPLVPGQKLTPNTAPVGGGGHVYATTDIASAIDWGNDRAAGMNGRPTGRTKVYKVTPLKDDVESYEQAGRVVHRSKSGFRVDKDQNLFGDDD